MSSEMKKMLDKDGFVIYSNSEDKLRIKRCIYYQEQRKSF